MYGLLLGCPAVYQQLELPRLLELLLSPVAHVQMSCCVELIHCFNFALLSTGTSGTSPLLDGSSAIPKRPLSYHSIASSRIVNDPASAPSPVPVALPSFVPQLPLSSVPTSTAALPVVTDHIIAKADTATLQRIASALVGGVAACMRCNDVYLRLQYGLPIVVPVTSSGLSIQRMEGVGPAPLGPATGAGALKLKDQRLRAKALDRLATEQHQRVLSLALAVQCLLTVMASDSDACAVRSVPFHAGHDAVKHSAACALWPCRRLWLMPRRTSHTVLLPCLCLGPPRAALTRASRLH